MAFTRVGASLHMHLPEAHRKLLVSLARGSTLKVHRDMHGTKVYKLHPLDRAPAEVIPAAIVDHLRNHKLIDSNMKFPAAVYLLTDTGAAIALRLAGASHPPLGSRKYNT
jgi:hypothetical protein